MKKNEQEEILGSKLNNFIDIKSSISYLIDTLIDIRERGTTFRERQIINIALGDLNKLNLQDKSLPKYISYDVKRDRYQVRRNIKGVRYTVGYSKSLPQAQKLLEQFNKKHNLK